MLAVVVVAYVLFAIYRSYQTSRDGSAEKRKAAKRKNSIGPIFDQKTYRSFPLVEKRVVSHNTRIFRFGLPAGTSLNLPTGKHLQFKAVTKYHDNAQYRSYTPISDMDAEGYFDLMVKVYENGVFSRHLDGLSIGDTVDIRGPKGDFLYVAGRYDSITMLAGGTGITPMLQIVKAVLKRPDDKTRVLLLFANVTEDDILLRDELDKWAEERADQFRVVYTVDKPSETWTGNTGFITADMIRDAGAAPPSENTMALVCGPGMMCKAMERELTELGFPEEKRHVF